MPFTRADLLSHFSSEKHLDYFATSAIRYSEFVARFGTQFTGMPITAEVRLSRQIEKDERFWTTCALKSVFDAEQFAAILKFAFGETPPLTAFSTWDDCVGKKKNQELRFEVAISSPLEYREALQKRFFANGATAHPVPYVVDAAKGRTTYEGATKVDAVFVNRVTEFCVMFETKVLSDISCDVTFDPFRNQLARNIDVMLDNGNAGFLPSDPSKRLLSLLTPQMFKTKPSTRYYGLLFHAYKNTSNLLATHLAHRDSKTLEQAPKRLGWLTFEECMGVCPGCCPWLATQGGAP